ncbi:hypothetical protein G7Z17_g10928 [Cylindrodendrum hubeiense]|uniref:Methyltransferase n=1 Tax=Cylindrodendrum hubeiense TaxID=595255 RepID=A0A9P5H659_9HYPO|nr:hypothetical protein G7Z17_g10928 [Cylindrodendrum hubeiense]
MAAVDPDPVMVPDNQVLDDHDSSLEESLTNTIFDYRRENGRTYHRYKDGKYNLPNDDKEVERLDLGTGTGIWAMDFGDEHPEAHISSVPPNVEFFVDDIDEEWNHSQPFEYIHSRMMTSSIANWRAYLQRIYDNLIPGGYAELQEADLFLSSDDGTLKTDHALARCLQLMHEASVQFGRAFQEIEPLKGMMEEVGFVDVVQTRRKWPINTWPQDPRHKELGAWSRMNLDDGLEAFTMAPLTRAHGWDRDQVIMFLVDVRKDLNNKGIHAYWPV